MMKTILISAFSCTPNHGSEPGVGWNWSKLAACNGYKVIVLTRTKLKEKLEKQVELEHLENIQFVYCKSSKLLRKISIYLEYIFWQRKSWKIAKKICKKEQIDYLWFLTMGSIILPNYLYKIKNVPLIWGPVGGGENVLPNIYNEWSSNYRSLYHKKEKAIKFSKHLPWIRKLQNRSSKIILRTSMSRRIIDDKNQDKITIASETFFLQQDFEALDALKAKKEEDSFIFCFDGRLIAFKNMLSFAKAFASVCDSMPNAKLVIIGDGEQLEDIQKLSCKQIETKGALDRAQTLNFVASCDCFCFPSLREGTSWSLVEAMYLGKPVLCTDANGVGDLSNDCGCYRVHIDETSTNESIINDFKSLILQMYSLSQEERNKLGMLNKKRIEEFYSEKGAMNRMKEWFN